MKLSDLEKVERLNRELVAADRVRRAFELVPESTVTVRAHILSQGAYGVPTSVQLLPVPKDVAVSAALRDRAKIVMELAQLGVEVDVLGARDAQ